MSYKIPFIILFIYSFIVTLFIVVMAINVEMGNVEPDMFQHGYYSQYGLFYCVNKVSDLFIPESLPNHEYCHAQIHNNYDHYCGGV